VAHEKRDHNGQTERFPGKRFAKHEFDRKSGTGRGRDFAKDGHGKGNWGKPIEDDLNPHAGATVGEEEKTTAEGKEESKIKTVKEGEEGVKGEDVLKKKEEEEEDKNKTYEEFMAE